MPAILVNPIDESSRTRGAPAPRLDTLSGKRIALLDISKPGGNHFLDRIDLLLRKRYAVLEVLRLAKPTFTKPAPDETLKRIVESKVDGVVEGLAD